MTHYRCEIIGGRMRAQRQKRNMSLEQLAQETGLTKSFLSQVERGKANLSIRSLSAISAALKVPMLFFFMESDEDQIVRRGSELKRVSVPDSRFQMDVIWFGTNRKLEVMVGRLAPGEWSGDMPSSHHATEFTVIEECIYVLHGQAELELGDEHHILEAGDSAYFNGSVPHRFRALGSEELMLLFAITPSVLAR